MEEVHVFCDLCGVNISQSYTRFILSKKFFLTINTRYDLCETCANELYEKMDELKGIKKK